MTPLAFYLIIALMAGTLICAMGGICLWGAATDPKLKGLGKILGGFSYIGMGGLGLLTFEYMPSHARAYAVLSAAFVLLGVWLIGKGSRLRQGR